MLELIESWSAIPKFLRKSKSDTLALALKIESEGITENVAEWRTDVVSALTSALPVDKLMFEAADPAVFAYAPSREIFGRPLWLTNLSEDITSKLWEPM